MPLPTPPLLIADALALADLAGILRAEPLIAIDTESNSFHVYKERVCLLQISTRSMDYVVDPIAVDAAPLGDVLCDGRVTVLHGADYDVRCLKRQYGWKLPRLFDTMIAARRLGRARLGLSALVQDHFGVHLSKVFQRSDWGKRPLTPQQIAYAALDTHFLLPLHERLDGELAAIGATEEARREFERIAAAEPRERTFDPRGWRRLKGARALDGPSGRVLESLWVAREERARVLDLPPFKVLGEQTMVELASRRPRDPRELATIPGITPSVLRRFGDAIRAALDGALAGSSGG